MKLTRPAFSRMALQLTQRICLWHSWTTCLRTESFLKPFGLQDLRIFLRPIFSSGVWWKTQCIRTIPTQLMSWRRPSQNTFGMWTVLYWTRSSRTQFGVSINVWRQAGDTWNITCNFLYCNHHQVHRDFLITLYLRSVWASHIDVGVTLDWQNPISSFQHEMYWIEGLISSVDNTLMQYVQRIQTQHQPQINHSHIHTRHVQWVRFPSLSLCDNQAF